MLAREKAWECLCEICIQKQYSNLYLRKALEDVSEMDKALVSEIVYGTLQHHLYLHYQWEDLVSKKVKQKIALLLDMSIYQLFFLDRVPEYAIVNDAVEIAKGCYKGQYRSLVNAVLREVIRRGRRKIEGDECEVLAIETSHPLWIVKMWKAQYGEAVMKRICFDNLKKAKACARVNTYLTNVEEVMNDSCFKKAHLENALYYDGGNIANSEAYQKGWVSIQDEASQCVALALDPQANDVILDTCAAPGTKTTHLAELMKNQGKIIALDCHEHRVELIKKGAERLHIDIIEAICQDACDLSRFGEFDRILCDVPCSGYGVMKRKNDIKYHLQSSDMDEIIELQAKILNQAALHLKIGGRLVYSTCTLNKKENERQIERFLSQNPHYQCESMRTIFPYEMDSDGFFMAVLTRQA